jgi:hypothetical protein
VAGIVNALEEIPLDRVTVATPPGVGLAISGKHRLDAGAGQPPSFLVSGGCGRDGACRP